MESNTKTARTCINIFGMPYLPLLRVLNKLESNFKKYLFQKAFNLL